MSGSVNKVILIGHLGRDPEVRSFNNGGKVCNLNVATSESWRDKHSGERKEKTEWHRVAIFDEKLAEIAERYLRKGSQVYLEGQLQTRKWEKDGVDHYATEVVLQSFRGSLTLLGGKGERDEDPEGDPRPRSSSSGGGRQQQKPSYDDELDDEIPF